MNYTVFYSWQSDIESKFNRSFIQDALEKAARNISNNRNFSLEAVIDRDTYGVPGSPSIVEAITGKIARSDVFVCDVSVINPNSESRQTPNPNVLYELGFASAILGWDRIIMVQNIAFGGPDKLPFDLRGRRILQYNYDATIENKIDEKQNLKSQLVEIFNNALSYYSDSANLRQKEKVIWWGKWEIESKVKARGGQLHISRVSSDAFFFEITIFDGARTGEVSGKAQILTPHSAFARIQTFDNKPCEIVFRRRLDSDAWYVEVEEGTHCLSFHGMGATFSGSYRHVTEAVINRGYLDEIDLNEVERITGRYLPVFLGNFQQFGYSHDETSSSELTVITAGVKGLYTIMESIAIVDNKGTVWCACLDPDSEVVRYFTNDVHNSLTKPKEMQEWLDKFADRPLFLNGVLLQKLETEAKVVSKSKKDGSSKSMNWWSRIKPFLFRES